MLPSVLPPNPSLEHLKKQAKDVLKSYQSGDIQVCKLLQKYLPRFARQSDQEILAGRISLHDAQHVVARWYGFDNWSALREAVTRQQGTRAPTVDSLNEKLKRHIEALGFATMGSYRIWCHKRGLDSSLDKKDTQLQQERELRLEVNPQPTQAHRRGQAEKITRVYRKVDKKRWLVNLFDATEGEAEREALYRLLIHIEKYTRINWDAAAQLSRYHRDWLNPVEKWFPKNEGSNRQLAELTRYLLGHEDVLLFRNARLLQEQGPSARRRRARVKHRGNTVLSQGEIASFEEVGYVNIRQAFPREAALKMQDFMWSELKRLHNFDRNDPSSWKMDRWKPTEWTRLKRVPTRFYVDVFCLCCIGIVKEFIIGISNLFILIPESIPSF